MHPYRDPAHRPTRHLVGILVVHHRSRLLPGWFGEVAAVVALSWLCAMLAGVTWYGASAGELLLRELRSHGVERQGEATIGSAEDIVIDTSSEARGVEPPPIWSAICNQDPRSVCYLAHTAVLAR
jgi:hypothetical protein